MCGCEKLENCHRLVIAGELLKQGIETVEISDWKKYLKDKDKMFGIF